MSRLGKSKGDMYEWVTHVWNPLDGKCPHGCDCPNIARNALANDSLQRPTAEGGTLKGMVRHD